MYTGQVLEGTSPPTRRGTPVVVGCGAMAPLWDVGVVGQEFRKDFLIFIMSELFQIMTCVFFDVSDVDPTPTK